uniref:Integrase catalytic domain-containing protein n=1 Tax=Tanacetum cinerariifolium TaxID=118510 RepID=A0A6L2MRX7_TANCI|nr:hypothetical protein [Tanacetum cinerariifolium]
MNYLEEQTDGEVMINSIKNDDQPLPRVTKVSIAETSSTEQPSLKDKSMWSDQEKKIQKIDRLARSLLIQGLPNDIYSVIDSNKTAKDLWDALARHMLGSEYGEQDRKAAVLYEYETFKATKGEYFNDAMGLKKKNVVVTSDPLALIAEKTKIDSSFQQMSSLKPYVPNVILEKIIINLEDEVVSLLDKENENLKTIEFLKSKDVETGVESSEKIVYETENKSENDCQVIEKVCDSEDNPNVISPGMFKLSVSQSVSPISVIKTSCASNSVESKLKRKRRKRTSSKQHDKQVNKDVLRANKAFVHSSNLYSLSSVRRPKPSGGMWMKGSSNIDKADLSSINHSNLNKNVKRYSRKNLMACNNSDTRSAFDCNNARNALCNARINDSVDVNDLFVFDDHMTGNRALLTNFVKKFLETVRFGNNDFVVIAGYGDVVIGSMTIKKAYYVEGKIRRKQHKSKMAFAANKPFYLLHMDLFGPMRVESINGKRYVLVVVDDYSRYTWRVRTNNGTEFKNKTLAKFFDEVGITQQFYVVRTPQQNGIVERRNRTLVEVARTMLTFANKTLAKFFDEAEAIATAYFTQNCSIIYKRFNKTPYELMNKRKPNIKFFYVFECRCYLLNYYDDVGKLKEKGDIGVFVGYSKESTSFKIYNKRTDSQVSETSKKDLKDLFQKIYDEYFDSSKIMKSSTTNVETSNVKIPLNEEEVFHESSESFQEESSSSSLNDDVYQSLEEVAVPSSNIQSFLNNMVPNVDEASTSHNMFNKRLEDAYFDASTSFHDPSNVHTFYQPYPPEKKWTEDHPLHKIIGDPKSSVHTRGQLANSCLFSCLLSSIEPANVAKALRDVDWVGAMKEELDQFARLKV